MTAKRRPVKRLDNEYTVGSGKAQTLDTPSQLTNLLWRAHRNEMGKRDVAIVWMLFGSGMRINEVAQLKVKDVIYKNGELKKTFSLPGKYTKTNNSRAVYIVVRQQREALKIWIKQRIDEGGMLSDDGSYGGLRGDSPLFLVKKGGWHTLSFNYKKYRTKGGIKESLVCSSLENLMRDVIKSSGIHAGSSHSGRRTLATWLDRNGCGLDLIQYVLNHESPEMTIEYIDPSRKRIKQGFDSILTGLKMPKGL